MPLDKSFPIHRIPTYDAIMKKRTTTAQRNSTRKPRKLTKAKLSREFIHSLRGKYRGLSLLKALVEELEREF